MVLFLETHLHVVTELFQQVYLSENSAKLVNTGVEIKISVQLSRFLILSQVLAFSLDRANYLVIEFELSRFKLTIFC